MVALTEWNGLTVQIVARKQLLGVGNEYRNAYTYMDSRPTLQSSGFCYYLILGWGMGGALAIQVILTVVQVVMERAWLKVKWGLRPEINT